MALLLLLLSLLWFINIITIICYYVHYKNYLYNCHYALLLRITYVLLELERYCCDDY